MKMFDESKALIHQGLETRLMCALKNNKIMVVIFLYRKIKKVKLLTEK